MHLELRHRMRPNGAVAHPPRENHLAAPRQGGSQRFGRRPLALVEIDVGVERRRSVALAQPQIFTRWFGARYSFSPCWTLKAGYQASMLRTVSARKLPGAWPSVSTRWRSVGSRILVAKPEHKQ